MNQEELITYNGKQYKFKDLPSEVQEALKDENNNGIPDRLEPKVNTPKQTEFVQEPTISKLTVNQNGANLENVGVSLVKKYVITSTYFLIVSLAAGIIIFITFFLLGVARS